MSVACTEADVQYTPSAPTSSTCVPESGNRMCRSSVRVSTLRNIQERCDNNVSDVPKQLVFAILSKGLTSASTSGRRTQASFCRANMNAASAVLELPKDIEVPGEVAAIFQKLQNGSDIRGIAIAGKSILESTFSFHLLLPTRQSVSCMTTQVLRGRSRTSHPL